MVICDRKANTTNKGFREEQKNKLSRIKKQRRINGK
jgi:hypothetical protein